MKTLEEPEKEETVRSWRNTLIKYPGGGYDGCMWEWNYAFIDRLGKFHTVLATGSRGCTTMEELVDYLTGPFESFPPRPVIMFLGLEDPTSEFRSETNDGNVLFVARWLHDRWPEFDLHGPCDTCHTRFPLHAAVHDGYRGNGGIGLAMEGVVCPECVERAMAAGDEEFYRPQPPVGGSPDAANASGESLVRR